MMFAIWTLSVQQFCFIRFVKSVRESDKVSILSL